MAWSSRREAISPRSIVLVNAMVCTERLSQMKAGRESVGGVGKSSSWSAIVGVGSVRRNVGAHGAVVNPSKDLSGEVPVGYSFWFVVCAGNYSQANYHKPRSVQVVVVTLNGQISRESGMSLSPPKREDVSSVVGFSKHRATARNAVQGHVAERMRVGATPKTIEQGRELSAFRMSM